MSLNSFEYKGLLQGLQENVVTPGRLRSIGKTSIELGPHLTFEELGM